MKKAVFVCLAISIVLSSACVPPPDHREDEPREIEPQKIMREEICFDFLQSEMITPKGGIRTNYLDKAHNADHATGAEVLSESMGLFMLYAAAIQDEALCLSALAFIQEYMDTGTIIAYRYSDENGARPVNAFVDDMRIIRALLLADDVFGGEYLDIALSYADRLYETNVKDHYVHDMYDEECGLCNDFITLCYMDLHTIQALGHYDEKWMDVYAVMRDIAAGGYISDEFPMYASSYSYGSGRYREGDINMIESALTALNLARIDECPQSTLTYLKDRIRDGAIYGVYSRDGRKKSDVESTAVYAICALIAKEVRDEEMYAVCIDSMNRYQVIDSTSEVYGAFADPVTLDLYSFDNLMALLAYRQR